jgi:uncharacterized protein (DUF302 family)
MNDTRRKFLRGMAAMGFAVFLPPVQHVFTMLTTAPGIVSKESKYSVKESMDRLQKILQEKAVTIFARIDQQAEAQKAGLTLSSIELIIFGNPKTGTPIMSAVPLAALALPLKVLAWQDNDNRVWLSYNELTYIQQRYSLADSLIKNIDVSPLVALASS